MEAYPDPVPAEGITAEKDLDVLVCSFIVSSPTKPGSTAVVKLTSRNWEYDEPLEVLDQDGGLEAEGEGLVMPPPEGLIEPDQALRVIADGAGSEVAFTRLVWKWEESVREPVYHFTLVDGREVRVGCISGTIR